MFYKLLVKRLIKNSENHPLQNEDGSIVTEKVKGKIKKETAEGTIEEDGLVDQQIIPTWILSETFFVYQQIDNNTHAAYYNEKGEPFSFESHEEKFEAEVIDKNAVPPFSN